MEIIREFHPQTHPDMTEAQKELFQKAQEAYRMRNTESLELVHEMLSDSKQIEEYQEELSQRLRAATAEREKLTAQIETMLKGATTHE